MKRKNVTKLFALALACSMLAGSTLPVFAEEAESLPREETLYWGPQQFGTVNDYNPLSSNSNNAMVMQQNDIARVSVYETLCMWNPLDGQMYPLLAAEVPTWDETQTKLTIKLNPDAKWSDGTQLTAEDVAYTFQFHMDHQSGTGVGFAENLEKVEVVDDTTLVLHAALNEEGLTKAPLDVMSYATKIYILQKAYLEKVAERNNNDSDAIKLDRMEDLVASGPYMPYIENDQKVVLVRNDSYWGQAESMWGKLPAPKYLANVIYKDNAAGETAMRNGEVDITQHFIAGVQKMWEEEDLPVSTYIDEEPYGICTTMPTMFFNTERNGLDQVAVCKAIAMAIDYDQIIASALSGQSPTFDDVPRSLMNPTDGEQAMVDHDALEEYRWANADIEGAKALLDEAGVVDTDGDGIREYNGENLSYKAECPAGWSDWNATMEIVAAAGKEIGITIETYYPDASIYFDDMTTGNFDICMWSGPGSSVANPYMRACFALSSEFNDLEVNWSGNYGHYSNERADEILDLIPYETDEAVLKEYYTELSKIQLEDCPNVSLMYRPEEFYAVSETVWTGFPMYDDGTNIPPLNCMDGYGIAALYNLELIEE